MSASKDIGFNATHGNIGLARKLPARFTPPDDGVGAGACQRVVGFVRRACYFEVGGYVGGFGGGHALAKITLHIGFRHPLGEIDIRSVSR